jgi:hypothetical protein
MLKVEFGECLYVTCETALSELPQDFQIDSSIKIKLVEPFASITDYSRYVLKDAVFISSKPFFLFVQWDSWVLTADSWTKKFLEYDFIGAVWPHHKTMRVGNGGFSLRSRRLMSVVASLADLANEGELEIEDDFICRKARTTLEFQFGCRFAPEDIADSFSAERQGWEGVPFGFHGLLNYGRVLGSRELSAELNSLRPFYFGDRHSVDLAKYLIFKGRHDDARLVIRRRVQLSGWTKKNLKLLLRWALNVMLAPRIAAQSFGRTSD